ncbi:MAG: collagen-like protein [Mojavia pulchra JT2-VF2]|uniref:Collagen-like protein n=1 Tax=Mojavia pulchra JT2-VF2 TaxID=287848 RepID=A0A951UHR5_9NOST|nr:collagen-like protein [Mojavia pulchra JT2-VF2]
MLKGSSNKLPLILIFCLFTSFLPASGSVFCPAIANDGYGRNYGTDGSKGTDGRPGRNGRNGQNQSIFVDGSSANLDLSGENGEDGEDGIRGYRPDCGYQPDNVSHDINAPDGGNGGDGGKGGDGGHGGSITAYYTNLADLRNVFVRATGGEGGRGGRGGNGGVGCNCRQRSWEVETCQGTPGTPSYKCTKKRYRCHDGRDGRYGNSGSNGSRGRLGTLSIIKGKESLVDDIPTLQTPISELTGKQFNLSKNKWNLRTGAASLLAPGSVIADEYREFDQRLEGTFQLIWRDKQPLTSFANQAATLNLNDSKQVEITFPEDLWIDGSSKTEANLTTFTVNNAIAKKDATRLAVAEFAGAEQNLNLKIVDLAAKSNIIQTQFRVKFRAQDNLSGLSDYQTVYEGEIPAELVKRDYNRFILALGKLPIRVTALNPGVNVDIEVVATRSLSGRSAKQSINWQGAIRRGIGL